ncbi:MAG TPA: PAS domain S-box protein, partial [Elusimicrobiota bacterium]|nr:PAS domain S-box protein [Elusimicrobiota bacterium]
PDGSILWLRTNKMPLHDTQGHVIGIVGTYEDITDRKQMQDLLEKKERYFRSLIENTSDLITVLDVDGYIRYESPSINRVLGFDPQQMYGKKAMEFVHPEDQEMVLSILSHAIGHPGTPASCEYRFQARDGSWKILHSVGSFLPDDGTGARIVVNSRDITDRRRTDEELRFRNVLLSTQSESSPDGILVVDAENRIAMRNQRFIQMWNVPADLAQSMSDDPILTHILSQMTNANEFVERVNYLYEHREEISREEIKLKDGRLFERYTAPMLGPNEKYYGRVWFFRDISERRKLESAMRQSEKLSAVGQLAAGVAHEINNPLGVILGFAQAIARRVKPGDSLELPLKSIEREAVRCKNLVQDLLTFSRASRLEREPIDLNRAITSALSLINAQARVAHVEVKQEFDDELPHVLGNMNQIQQVVINLTNNAMDAMKDGGLLTIKTERYVDGPLTWACLWIIDNGPGIPLDIQPRIFEPFFTTKPVGKGTGLGLSLVHEIVQKLSGTIHMKSEPGRTEFCVKLPIRNPPTGAPERRASKDPL